MREEKIISKITIIVLHRLLQKINNHNNINLIKLSLFFIYLLIFLDLYIKKKLR